MKVVGYLRVSTREQDYGIEVQRSAIQMEAVRRGWEIEWIIDQGETGKNAQRPGLAQALAILEAGEADALVVSKLDRLSRSVVAFGAILRRATQPSRRRRAWGLVALDVGIDMTTPTGRLVAHILIAVAEWEGDTISERTKAALAVTKRERGVVPGAASRVPPRVAARINHARRRGQSFRAIAERLNAAGVPSARGGVWHASTVQHVYYSARR